MVLNSQTFDDHQSESLGQNNINNINNNMNAYAIDETNPAFNQTPLAALSNCTRQQLARMLNCKKVLRSEEGYERDWRGIAALSQQKHFCDETAITTDNPFEKVLQFWIRNNPRSAKIGYLVHFLGTIDRWDVCDDIQENLSKDTDAFNAKQKAINQNLTWNSDDTDNASNDDQFDCNKNSLNLQKYDAFVLYADANIDLATEIMTQLENNSRYNLKLYLKDRDMLGGITFEHVELIGLIEDQCKHLIVVLTDEFLMSPENAFLVNYTQALQIQNNLRKIIPIIYKANMIIPKTLKIYTHLKFNNSGLFNFWDKLAKSVQDTSELTPYYGRGFSLQTPSPIMSTPATVPRYKKYEKSVSTTSSTASTNEPPRITINDTAYVPPEEEKSRKYEKKSQSTNHPNNNTNNNNNNNNNNSNLSPNGVVNGIRFGMRHAQSVGQLNMAPAGTTAFTASSSNLSVTSETKKKKKWRPKILSKVFSRSSKQLQEPC